MSRGWYQKLKEEVGEEEAKRRSREQVNRWNAENRERQRQNQRRYIAENREVVRARRQEWRAANREKEKEADARRKRENPEKYAARQAVRDAIRRGKLVRPELCGRCGQRRRITAHHADYGKPLEVEWLCTTCHGAEHRVS